MLVEHSKKIEIIANKLSATEESECSVSIRMNGFTFLQFQNINTCTSIEKCRELKCKKKWKKLWQKKLYIVWLKSLKGNFKDMKKKAIASQVLTQTEYEEYERHLQLMENTLEQESGDAVGD